jgi:YHS domain-containing protein
LGQAKGDSMTFLQNAKRPVERRWRQPTSFNYIPLLLLLSGGLFLFSCAATRQTINKSFFGGVAIKGYDPVAYFTQGKAVKGKEKFELKWRGARWRFANADHRKDFRQQPEKYAPQYGGFCAWAMARGQVAPISPQRQTQRRYSVR